MQTNPILPTTVIPNSTPGIDWLTPNNILLADGDFAVSGGDTQILTVGNFQVNLSQGDTVTNIVFAVKGYRGSFDTTLQIFAVDDTSGTSVEYELLPSFQGFDGDNTLYTLDPSLFGTTWSVNKINNIKIKLIANGELHLDYVTLNVIYTPEATETLTYDTLTGTFDVGDTILGGDSGATALIVTDNGASSMTITSIDGVFIVGETITGTPSGATAVVTDPFTTGEIVVDEFVQAQPFQLAQSMTSTAISCLVQSFNYSDGRPIAYADFYGNALIVVDQGTPSEENIRITDVQQNYNGTGYTRLDFGSLSNRGLEFKYPYTTNADLRFDHSGTAEVVISNSAPFYDRFLKKGQIGALVSAPISVDDEGVEITDYVTSFDFIGSGVTATETTTGHVEVSIPGVSGSQEAIQFQNEGVDLGVDGTVDTLDFVGAGVNAARAGDKVTVTITGGGGGGGGVNSVTSSDDFIDVDNGDPSNPVLSLDIIELANDTTFITELTDNTTFQTNVNNFITTGGVVVTGTAAQDLVVGNPVGISNFINDNVAISSTPYLLQAFGATPTSSRTVYINTDKIAIAYIDSANSDLMLRVGTLNRSTMTFTFGTAITITTDNPTAYSIVKLDTDKVSVQYNTASALTVVKTVVVTVSTNTATAGTPVNLFTSGTSVTSIVSIQNGTDNTISYIDDGTNHNYITCSISGTTPTPGTPSSTSLLSGLNLCLLDTNKFCCTGNNGAVSVAQVGTISSGVITLGSVTSLGAASATINSLVSFDTNKFIVNVDIGANAHIPCTVSGTTITVGTSVAFDDNGVYIVTSPTSVVIDSNIININSNVATRNGYLYTSYSTFGQLVDNGQLLAKWYIDFSTSNIKYLVSGMSQTFMGIAQESVSKGETVSVLIKGVDNNQSGLIAGSLYDFSGTSLVPNASGVVRALSATEIVI